MWLWRIAAILLILLCPGRASAQSPDTVAKAMKAYTPIYVACGDQQYMGSGTYITPTIVVTAKHLRDEGIACTYSGAGDAALEPLAEHRTADLMLLKSARTHAFVVVSAPRLYGKVFFIGTPFGEPGFVVFGRLTRWTYQDKTVAFSDATIHPGYSGGGVFNESGDLVGIAVAVWTDTNYAIFLSSILIGELP